MDSTLRSIRFESQSTQRARSL